MSGVACALFSAAGLRGRCLRRDWQHQVHRAPRDGPTRANGGRDHVAVRRGPYRPKPSAPPNPLRARLLAPSNKQAPVVAHGSRYAIAAARALYEQPASKRQEGKGPFKQPINHSRKVPKRKTKNPTTTFFFCVTALAGRALRRALDGAPDPRRGRALLARDHQLRGPSGQHAPPQNKHTHTHSRTLPSFFLSAEARAKARPLALSLCAGPSSLALLNF